MMRFEVDVVEHRQMARIEMRSFHNFEIGSVVAKSDLAAS